MAREKTSPELRNFLKALDKETLAAIADLYRDTKKMDALLSILRLVKDTDEARIVRAAGGIVSMDTMVNNSVNQSFYRGRISLAVLINTIIKLSGDELEKRESSSKKK